MTRPITESGASEDAGDLERRLIDPRDGDVEDDAASPAQRSLLAIASSMLVEISLPKLLFAWFMSLVLPAVLLGLAPLAVAVWFASISAHVKTLTEIGAGLVLAAIVAIGWLAWRPLLRVAESNFWALNALVVQPGYLLGAELLRHLAERAFAGHMTDIRRTRLRAASSAAAGVIMCACAIVVLLLVWPYSRWTGTVAELALVHRLIVPMIANAVVLIMGYLAAASLVWGFADAMMDQPADFSAFDVAPAGRRFRIAHLSDLHAVGERYGFRIESGRRGPRGNARLRQALERLAEIHAARPLDLILISGDMTDAGRATEWAEFLDAIARYPALIARMIVLPGNHDLNIVDRANPARLDLPFSPGKRLRQMRTLSAIAAVQGDRVHIANLDDKPMRSLNEALAPYRRPIAHFAEHGGLRLAMGLGHIFGDQFPMLVLPDEPDGLGVAILNSNTESHFSFTNALGVISAEQARRLVAALGKFPDAAWIIALHHHLLEYPMPVAFSERVGTALVNGSWFLRKLKPFASRIVVMHGHRHTDWIGTCGSMKIISAPSPVMGADDNASTHFYIHTLVRGIDGRLRLIAPERVEISRPMPSA
ncbi:metallophosphoesterase family protein [Bradyrhizobium sp. STM 3562]|uniref:metallophosphoesterase family protein n=1 Tax=Bradyrhizobium sp. STM 3562 TaxID=578924 RepID=UPI0038910287